MATRIGKYTYNTWVGQQHFPKDRLKLLLSPDDQEAIKNLPAGESDATVTVTDLNSGNVFKIKRASCGLPGCGCAVKLAETF